MAGSEQAATAAATMASGVGKSGSPAPKPMTSRPAALSAFAFASTARVALSLIAAIRAEIRRADVADTGPSFRMAAATVHQVPRALPVRPACRGRRTLARPALVPCYVASDGGQ